MDSNSLRSHGAPHCVIKQLLSQSFQSWIFLLREARYRTLSQLSPNKTRANLSEPLVSFTFDDAPLSAFTEGIPILEEFDYRATFYISGSYCDSDFYLRHNEILSLIQMKHEIACHSFSHLRADRNNPLAVLEDCKRNRQFIQKHFGYELKNFAFPFGACGLLVKGPLAKIYNSLRSVYPGINAGEIDLSLLRANPVYGVSKEQAQELIKQTIQKNGWLIFFNHAVKTNPPQYGSTPDKLRFIVEKVFESKLKVVTVEEAIKTLRSHPL